MAEAVGQTDAAGLDYQPWGFEGTKLRFRGPPVDLNAPFVAVLGGTETYGKYVETPFPVKLQEWINTPVANLGVHQAGLTLFSEERWLLETASRADVCILQVLGAQNMSNRMYSVHARRNDRFLAASDALREMYQGVDFAEINFTGHLLKTLYAQSEIGFAKLMDELKWAWIQRMKRIVQMIECDVILLWASDRSPNETGHPLGDTEPMFVDREMLDALEQEGARVVEVVLPDMHETAEGMVFSDGKRGAATALPGPAEHTRIAEVLAEAIAQLRENVDAIKARA
ncbi:MAG: DUF6473 family protein [Pseudomonadota bacterium]